MTVWMSCTWNDYTRYKLPSPTYAFIPMASFTMKRSPLFVKVLLENEVRHMPRRQVDDANHNLNRQHT